MLDDSWTVVPEAGVLSLLVRRRRVYPTPFATYVVGPEVFIVIMEPGDRPNGTAVQNRGLLGLVGPFPEAVNAYLYDTSWKTSPRYRPPTASRSTYGFDCTMAVCHWANSSSVTPGSTSARRHCPNTSCGSGIRCRSKYSAGCDRIARALPALSV